MDFPIPLAPTANTVQQRCGNSKPEMMDSQQHLETSKTMNIYL